MTGHGAKFGRKQEEAIAALLVHRSIEEAARAAGVGYKTLLRWLEVDDKVRFPLAIDHILESMTKGALSFLLLAGIVFGQTTAKLTTDLSALANPRTSLSTLTNRVAEDVLALAEKDAQPSRGTVLDFAAALTKALAGKAASQPQLEKVTSAIVDVLQSSGTPAYRFHSAIDRLRASLIDLGAKRRSARSHLAQPKGRFVALFVWS